LLTACTARYVEALFMICFLLLLSRTAEAGVRSVAHIRQRERSAKALPSPPPTLSRGG
jgi:hypothetical protein